MDIRILKGLTGTLSALAMSAMFAGSANAALIDSWGATYSCTDGAQGGEKCGGGAAGSLSAQANFAFYTGDYSGSDPILNGVGTFYLALSFRNTSTAYSYLSGFGFDFPATGNVVGYDANNTDYDTYEPGNKINGVAFDACAMVGTNPNGNCGGGSASGGLTAPPVSPWVTVYFDFTTNAGTTAEQFIAAWRAGFGATSSTYPSCVRFQSVGQTGFGEESGSACATLRDRPYDQPEPGTLALLGLGLFGLALSRRRVKL